MEQSHILCKSWRIEVCEVLFLIVAILYARILAINKIFNFAPTPNISQRLSQLFMELELIIMQKLSNAIGPNFVDCDIYIYIFIYIYIYIYIYIRCFCFDNIIKHSKCGAVTVYPTLSHSSKGISIYTFQYLWWVLRLNVCRKVCFEVNMFCSED